MTRKHYEKFAEYLLQGKEGEAVKLVDKLLTEHPRLYLFEDIITPAMYYIGVLWEKNEISVADEHLATAGCDFVISRLDAGVYENNFKSEKRKKIILLGAEEEQHYLGLKMVAGFYREKGWRVRYLGPNLPLDHALSQIKDWQPDVIGLSAALSYRLPVVKQMTEAFSQLSWSPGIIIGGRIAKKYDLSNLETGQVRVVKGLAELEQVHNVWKAGVVDETS
ncbi:cobalamin-binding protein [Thalassobacillus devorans]|uniref:Cobalamin-binding protein n=1 Tax=Thalassobacillus devorans TaxID=279813 RepID=A0ABQ1NRW2_9BACI|nr:cobalamin B12-binding domain-containing protein [Thalassobacillus devorans]NIK29014.1 methanogenic corrinoid protein MtbC1 [Thalassobacillus devorans]GGC81825.1 cobalamin-binding protein [Thalassobacillus devorans]